LEHPWERELARHGFVRASRDASSNGTTSHKSGLAVACQRGIVSFEADLVAVAMTLSSLVS
jgi:hypothetical protein